MPAGQQGRSNTGRPPSTPDPGPGGKPTTFCPLWDQVRPLRWARLIHSYSSAELLEKLLVRARRYCTLTERTDDRSWLRHWVDGVQAVGTFSVGEGMLFVFPTLAVMRSVRCCHPRRCSLQEHRRLVSRTAPRLGQHAECSR